jgi:hypothetical protein
VGFRLLKQVSGSLAPYSRLAFHTLNHLAGAPLDKAVGDILTSFTTVLPLMGSSEVGPSALSLNKDPMDWNWYNFNPASGLSFFPFQDDLYESIYIKHEDPEKANRQMVFHTFPDLQFYPTRDLWRKHPTKEGLWEYAGRSDDFVKLSSLTKFNATHIEGIVLQDPRIQAAVVGGDGKSVPFLLLELAEGVKEKEALEVIWPPIETINAKMSKDIRLGRNMIIFTNPGKSMVRVENKGTTSRKATIEKYAQEIEDLYLREGGLTKA